MMPFQSLTRSLLKAPVPTPKVTNASSVDIDPDSVVAHSLQPLLEQEALLETYIAEATARRKFDDVKTLQISLAELRTEIDTIAKRAFT
jgi:hypothetical protein